MESETKNDEYVDGWVGITKSEYKQMYKGISSEWPVWCEVSNGLGFDAKGTLKANGIHPDMVPSVLRDGYTSGKIIKKIAEHIPLTFVDTPD